MVMNPKYARNAKLLVSSAISSVSGSATLASQQYFVSQATQDTVINVGKSTVTADDDVTEVAQSFTADGPYVGDVTAYAAKVGTPTDNIVCKLYSDSTGPYELIATSDGLSATDLSETPEAETFTFEFKDYSRGLIVGKKYWIVFDRTGSASDTNYYSISYKGTSSTVADQTLSRSDDNMTSWTNDGDGCDLYHVIYAGEIPITEFKIDTGEVEATVEKRIGYNEVLVDGRSKGAEITFKSPFEGTQLSELISGAAQAVTGNYYRHTFGEKASNDRTTKSLIVKIYDGTNNWVYLMNNAYVTTLDNSSDADSHFEESLTAKSLSSNVYLDGDAY